MSPPSYSPVVPIAVADVVVVGCLPSAVNSVVIVTVAQVAAVAPTHDTCPVAELGVVVAPVAKA